MLAYSKVAIKHSGNVQTVEETRTPFAALPRQEKRKVQQVSSMVHLEDLPSHLPHLRPGWHRIMFCLQLQYPNNSHCTDDTLGCQLLCLRPRLAHTEFPLSEVAVFLVHNFSILLFASTLTYRLLSSTCTIVLIFSQIG